MRKAYEQKDLPLRVESRLPKVYKAENHPLVAAAASEDVYVVYQGTKRHEDRTGSSEPELEDQMAGTSIQAKCHRLVHSLKA